MRGTSGAPSAAARACAWGGALLFAASLSYFLYSYGVTFGAAPPAGTPALPAVLANAALFTAFAMHHSAFARLPVRALVTRVVPPALERSLYVWVSSALFIGVCAWWQPVPGVAWSAAGALWWGLAALQLAGVWLTLRSAASIDVLDLAGVRQISAARPPTAFTTAGPYGWVRHPIYAGWLLLVFCAPRMTMTRLVFAAVSSGYLIMAIPWEERSLLAASGDQYRSYMRRVKWKLLPGVY